jgi:hypothetical protein
MPGYDSSTPGKRWSGRGSFGQMQTTRPRDLGALILAIGVLLVLFIVSLSLGAPLR